MWPRSICKSGRSHDLAEKMVEWMNTLKETVGSTSGAIAASPSTHTAKELASAPAAPVKTDVPGYQRCGDEGDCRSQRDRKAQFAYADLLARTVSQLEAKPGVCSEQARTGIDAATEREQPIPPDRERPLYSTPGLWTNTAKAPVADPAPELWFPHARYRCCALSPFSDAVSAGPGPANSGDCLRPGRGGGQRERAELTLMAGSKGEMCTSLRLTNADRGSFRSRMRGWQGER